MGHYWMVFDIETVPDAEMGRRWLMSDVDEPDSAVRRGMLNRRLEQTGQSHFLKPPFHQVVAIAAALIDEDGIIRKLGPLGSVHDGEPDILRDFFHVIDEITPRLVGWNSSGFDIPTLLYRALRYDIAVPTFYQAGLPYHGYRKRYDEEWHVDLMDVLSGYGASPRVSLEEAALLLGVPGKLDVVGDQVLDLYEAGAVDHIRQYCSHDVLSTALIFMRYAHQRGWIDSAGLQTFWDSARRWVREDRAGIWESFGVAWQALGEDLTKT